VYHLGRLRLRHLHLGVRALRRAPLHLAGTSLHPARDRLPVRLCGLPRHRAAGWAHRPAGAALRRADASRGGLRVHGHGIPLPRAHRGARAAGCGDDALSLRPGRAPPDAHQSSRRAPAGTSRVWSSASPSRSSRSRRSRPRRSAACWSGAARSERGRSSPRSHRRPAWWRRAGARPAGRRWRASGVRGRRPAGRERSTVLELCRSFMPRGAGSPHLIC